MHIHALRHTGTDTCTQAHSCTHTDVYTHTDTHTHSGMHTCRTGTGRRRRTHVALEGLLPGVRPPVLVQAALLAEGLAAVRALVGLLLQRKSCESQGQRPWGGGRCCSKFPGPQEWLSLLGKQHPHICWAACKPGSGVPAPHRHLHVTGGRTWHSCLLSAAGISLLSQRPWLLWPRGRPLGRCPGRWAPVTFLESAREPQRLSAPAPGATLTLTDRLEPPAGPSR